MNPIFLVALAAVTIFALTSKSRGAVTGTGTGTPGRLGTGDPRTRTTPETLSGCIAGTPAASGNTDLGGIPVELRSQYEDVLMTRPLSGIGNINRDVAAQFTRNLGNCLAALGYTLAANRFYRRAAEIDAGVHDGSGGGPYIEPAGGAGTSTGNRPLTPGETGSGGATNTTNNTFATPAIDALPDGFAKAAVKQALASPDAGKLFDLADSIDKTGNHAAAEEVRRIAATRRMMVDANGNTWTLTPHAAIPSQAIPAGVTGATPAYVAGGVRIEGLSILDTVQKIRSYVLSIADKPGGPFGGGVEVPIPTHLSGLITNGMVERAVSGLPDVPPVNLQTQVRTIISTYRGWGSGASLASFPVDVPALRSLASLIAGAPEAAALINRIANDVQKATPAPVAPTPTGSDWPALKALATAAPALRDLINGTVLNHVSYPAVVHPELGTPPCLAGSGCSSTDVNTILKMVNGLDASIIGAALDAAASAGGGGLGNLTGSGASKGPPITGITPDDYQKWLAGNGVVDLNAAKAELNLAYQALQKAGM